MGPRPPGVRMASPMSLLLIVGYVAAIGLGAYELKRAPSLALPPAPPEQAAQALPPLELPPEVIRSLAAYDAIIERPLFSSDRRPEAEEAAAAQSASGPAEEGAVEIDGFRLTAVLRDGSSTTVLIEDKTGKTRALHAGDRLGSWQLGEILDDRVALVADGRRETLMVYDFSPKTKARPVRRDYRRIPQLPRPRPVREQDDAAEPPGPPDQPETP